MFYGWCLTRIIHFIVSLRRAHPDKRIFISKYDYSDAYQRMAHSATAAAMSIAVLLHVAYIAIRLTFGGGCNPPSWCLFSEMVTDLANEIACCSQCDPKLLRSPSQPHTPEPMLSQSAAPLAKALPLAVVVPVTHTARVECFIDDLINCFLDAEENRARQPHVVPLAMHCTSRPHTGDDEPISWFSMPFGSRAGCGYFNLIVLGNGNLFQQVINLPLSKRKVSLREMMIRIVERRCVGASGHPRSDSSSLVCSS
jgi:hypothetical protein